MSQIELTEKAQELLDAVNSFGGTTVTRRDIADKLGKKRLTQSDHDLLDVLAKLGQIEAQQIENDKPTGYMWVYRSKE